MIVCCGFSSQLCGHANQGRTQEFFPGGGGGQDYLQYSRGNASEGAKRPSGGGCGRGCPPLPHEGAFAFLRLKLNDLVHTLGGFGKIVNTKSKKKIHIHGKYSRKNASEGAKRPSGGRVWELLHF